MLLYLCFTYYAIFSLSLSLSLSHCQHVPFIPRYSPTHDVTAKFVVIIAVPLPLISQHFLMEGIGVIELGEPIVSIPSNDFRSIIIDVNPFSFLPMQSFHADAPHLTNHLSDPPYYPPHGNMVSHSFIKTVCYDIYWRHHKIISTQCDLGACDMPARSPSYYSDRGRSRSRTRSPYGNRDSRSRSKWADSLTTISTTELCSHSLVCLSCFRELSVLD